MSKIRIYFLSALILSSGLMIFSCAAVREVSQALSNLKNLQFKLESVQGFSVAGVQVNGKSQISDFSLTDGLKLTQAFGSQSLPADFLLNVAARNPNDGSNGNMKSTMTLTKLDWILYIDNVQTISGIMDKPFEIPGNGQSTIIPVRVSLDLFKFFRDKGYDGIVNIALSLGGVKSSPSRLRLDCKPTVQSPFGPISSGYITVVDKQFN